MSITGNIVVKIQFFKIKKLFPPDLLRIQLLQILPIRPDPDADPTHCLLVLEGAGLMLLDKRCQAGVIILLCGGHVHHLLHEQLVLLLLLLLVLVFLLFLWSQGFGSGSVPIH